MIYLNRLVSTDKFIKGVLCNDDGPLCYTLELPWRDNARDISCIPEGVYDVYFASSVRFGPCFRFAYVGHRSNILIHVGNFVGDTRGCILPGLDVDEISVLHSRQAMDRLFVSLPGVFKLCIRSI